MKIINFRRKIPEEDKLLLLFSKKNPTKAIPCRYTGRYFDWRPSIGKYVVHTFNLGSSEHIRGSRRELLWNYKGWCYIDDKELMAYL